MVAGALRKAEKQKKAAIRRRTPKKSNAPVEPAFHPHPPSTSWSQSSKIKASSVISLVLGVDRPAVGKYGMSVSASTEAVMAKRTSTTHLVPTRGADYGSLLSGISELLQQARRAAARAVNR